MARDIIAGFLKERHTKLRLPDYSGGTERVIVGIPQGSPLSLALFVVFNADLVDELTARGLTIAWIDDTSILVTGTTYDEVRDNLQEASAICSAWTAKHAAVFDFPKFQLMYLKQKHSRTRTDTLSITYNDGNSEQIIVPKKTCKLLGVLLDERLSFKEHNKVVKGTALSRITQMALLGTKSTVGVGTVAYDTVSNAVIKPTFLYACSAWFYLEEHTLATAAFQAVQRKALLLATGAFKRTSNASLEVVTNNPPVLETLNQVVLTTAIRLGSTEPGRTLLANASTTANPQSPLGRLKRFITKEVGSSILEVENRTAFVAPPWGFFPKTIALDDADEAIALHDSILEQEGLHIYTDGSGIKDKVGAAAVCIETSQAKAAYVGPFSKHTVYCGEVHALDLAIQLVAESGACLPVHIFTDNRGAVQSASNSLAKGGQQFFKQFHATIAELPFPVPITIYWIPSHTGLYGNLFGFGLSLVLG